MAHILRAVKRGPVSFTKLFSSHPTREEVVTLFLATLELLKLGKITCIQYGIFDDIAVAGISAGES